MTSSQGGDVFRINPLVKTVEVRQQATMLQYVSTSHPGAPAERVGMLTAECVLGETNSLWNHEPKEGWPDATHGDWSKEGKRRPVEYVIGLMSCNLNGPCHFRRWTSNVARKW